VGTYKRAGGSVRRPSPLSAETVHIDPSSRTGGQLSRKIEGTQETTKADKPHTYALRLTGAGGARATVEITNKEAGSGTDMTIDIDYRLPTGLFSGIAEKLLGGRVERDLRHSTDNFKELCEASVPARV